MCAAFDPPLPTPPALHVVAERPVSQNIALFAAADFSPAARAAELMIINRCLISSDTNALPVAGKGSGPATVTNLVAGKTLRGVTSFDVVPHSKKVVHQVALLVDGEKVASVNEDGAKLNRLKFDLATQLFPSGKHTLQVEVLDRPPGASYDYNVRPTKAVNVVFDNPIWVNHYTGVVEARLVVNFGTKLRGPWNATVTDSKGSSFTRSGDVARDLQGGNITFGDEPKRYPGISHFDVKISIHPEDGAPEETLAFQLKVRQR